MMKPRAKWTSLFFGFFSLFFISIFLVFLSIPILAQNESSGSSRIYVDITSPGQKKLQVLFYYSGRGSDEIKSYLEKDLDVYGIFLPLFTSSKLSMDDVRLIGAVLYVEYNVSLEGDSLITDLKIYSSESGEKIFEKILKAKSNEPFMVAHRIADIIYELITGRKGLLGREIVAVRKIGGGNEILLVDPGTRTYRRVLYSTNPILSPSFSPDRSKIIFSMMVHGDFDIYELELATGKYRKVCSTPGPDSTPVYSPDGSRIAFTGYKGAEGGIFLCDPKTGKVTPLIVERGVINTSPTWSPDGRELAYVSNRAGHPSIYIYDFSSNRIRRITAGRYDVDPDWSPDGEKIIYSSMEGGWFLRVYYLKTGNIVLLGNGEDPSFSVNSDYIVYVKGGNLFIRSLYGSIEVRVATGYWQNPYWR